MAGVARAGKCAWRQGNATLDLKKGRSIQIIRIDVRISPVATLEQPTNLCGEAHASPQPVIFVAFLAALIGEFVVVPAAKVLPTRWQVELPYTPATGPPLFDQWTPEPPAEPA